jgi:hypothetical protein
MNSDRLICLHMLKNIGTRYRKQMKHRTQPKVVVVGIGSRKSLALGNAS